MLNKDVQSQVLALYGKINDPNSFSGSFGQVLKETQERAQQIIEKLAKGEPLTSNDLKKFKTVCKAVEVGTNGWISDIESQFPAPRDPEIDKVIDSLNIYKAQLLEVMNCADAIKVDGEGDDVKYLTSHIVACDFGGGEAAAVGIRRQAPKISGPNCTKIIAFINEIRNAVPEGEDVSTADVPDGTCTCLKWLPINGVTYKSIKLIKSKSMEFSPIDAYALMGKNIVFKDNGTIISIELESTSHAESIADYIKLKNNGYVIVLNMDLNDPDGMGHSGMLVKKTDGKWQYISKNGQKIDNRFHDFFGGQPTFSDEEYNSISAFKAKSPEIYERYGRRTKVKVSDVNLVMQKGSEEVRSYYHYNLSNCGHAVNEALKIGGVKVDDSILTFRANEMYEYIRNNNKNYTINED